MKIRKRKIATLLAIVSFSSIILSGCQFIPPSKEKQYQNIDEFLDEIDYSSAGEIVEESIEGDGVFSVAVKRYTYDDPKAFDSLRDRVKEGKDSECTHESFRQLNCVVRSLNLNVNVQRKSSDPDRVVISVSDSSNGK